MSFQKLQQVFLFVVACWAMHDDRVAAFVPAVPATRKSVSYATMETARQSMLAPLQDAVVLTHATLSSAASTTNWIATIDSDISKLSDNEFAPVFMGGILVMLGGLFSAVFVGLIVDRKNLSAQIVAESYAQQQTPGVDDEAFWKGLSEEEKRKAQELLQRLQASKNKNNSNNNAPVAPPAVTAAAASTTTLTSSSTTVPAPTESNSNAKAVTSTPKTVGMFDDYGE